MLPPGHYTSSGCSNTNLMDNWALDILPFIEEQAVWTQYHFNKLNTDNSNIPAEQQIIATMNCPSDPNPPQLGLADVYEGAQTQWATGSYKGVGGRAWGDSPATDFWDTYQPGTTGTSKLRIQDKGPLPQVIANTPTCYISTLSSSPVKLKQITDGTSKSLLIGEYTTVTQPSGGPPATTRSVLWANSLYGFNVGNIALPQACLANPTTCSTAGWGLMLDPDYDKCLTNSTALGISAGDTPCKRTFAGVHGGGGAINFVLCDGSTRVFSTLVDLQILASFATIAGGESYELP